MNMIVNGSHVGEIQRSISFRSAASTNSIGFAPTCHSRSSKNLLVRFLTQPVSHYTFIEAGDEPGEKAEQGIWRNHWKGNYKILSLSPRVKAGFNHCIIFSSLISPASRPLSFHHLHEFAPSSDIALLLLLPHLWSILSLVRRTPQEVRVHIPLLTS